MKYGLIGERLGHSYSKLIHERLGYDYELCEIERGALDAFMRGGDFLGINVTIPYKVAVIPYLDELDESAREIGAVNTVVNRGGRLIGFNTDFYGMCELIRHAGIDISNKKLAILGTGGTSRTARAVARHLSAGEILTVSREPKEGAITYGELYSLHSDCEVIINTTPQGMYPDFESAAVDIIRLPSLIGVIDAVYNPLRTALVLSALNKGIAAQGGLYMLVAQAIRASEIFLERKYDGRVTSEIYSSLYKDMENIVLVGMPSSGKSTVGRELALRLSRELIDTDELIVKNTGLSIPEIFAKFGEEYFRERESEAIKEAASHSGVIIATGGGSVLRGKNVFTLNQTGKIFFIDRPLELLMPTLDRPLSQDRSAIEKRYRERYEIYLSAGTRIDGSGTPTAVADRILSKFMR